jgi:predicted CXXCH cytochrome family protein
MTSPSLRASFAAAALLLCAAAPPPAEKAPAPAKKPTGKLEVTVELKGKGTIQSGSIYLKAQKADFAAGKTTHLFENVSAARHALTADAMVADGGAARRYIGVQAVTVPANRTTKVALILEEAGSIEDYCRRCHPDPNQLTEADQIPRDQHYSGQPLQQKHIAQVEKYNARSEQDRKGGQQYNLPIILEKRTVVEEGKQVERLFYTCESCHTLHYTHEEEKYTRALFRKKGNLCRGCHP